MGLYGNHAHWMQNDLPQFDPVHDCLSSTKTIGFDFLENCGLVVPVFILSREKSSQVFVIARK